MKLYSALVVSGLLVMASLTPASAGAISTACMKSDRASNRNVCNCIQRVADLQLTRSDQKMAAKFFSDPHLAQETRQSDSAAKERFWKRYKTWGQTAAKTCS